MQSLSDAPSSPVSQSRLRPRGRRSTYLVTPVPTLVCEVPIDVVSVPHQYNHVPRGPLIPRPAAAHEGGEEQQPDDESAKRDGQDLLHISGSSGEGISTVIVFVVVVILHSLGRGGERPVVPVEVHQGLQPGVR